MENRSGTVATSKDLRDSIVKDLFLRAKSLEALMDQNCYIYINRYVNISDYYSSYFKRNLNISVYYSYMY